MSYEVSYTPDARYDLSQIERYLAVRFSLRNAEKYVQRILSFCDSLALAPFRGQNHENVRPGLRVVGFERRVTVLFVVEPKKVVILGVFYGGREVDLHR